MEVRPEVARFAELMEKRLRANDHKGGWTESNTKWLLMRLKQEVLELELALADHQRLLSSPVHGCPEHVSYEAADVANFALMVRDNIERAK